MNLRLACDLCGSQPCMCVNEECRRCEGEGRCETGGNPRSGSGARTVSECPDCEGAGWIKCSGPIDCAGTPSCPFDHCYCEAAYDRQQEYNASEPPMGARERQEIDWRQKQELRR